jgi:diguanylate cyclase (GGDEF)-like protein/PAS domain S-box-containing protein
MARGRGDEAGSERVEAGSQIKDEVLLAKAEEIASTGSFERDLRTGVARYSGGFCRVFGVRPDAELSREVLLERVHRDDRSLVEEAIALSLETRQPFTFEARITRFDGVSRTIRARGMVLFDGQARPLRLIGTVQDVTEEVEAHAAREMLSYVVDSTDDAIITKSREGTITSWNRGAERLYGYSAEEAIGAHVSIIQPSDLAGDQDQMLRRVFGGQSLDHYETERIRKDGKRITVSLTISPVRDANGRILSAAVIARDMTERVRYEQRLRHLADHDQLTGLVNRRRFDEELKRELARAGRYGTRGALLNFDIDNFKAINDAAGHAAGDAVLQEVASVLRSRFRATDVVARLGGDEFCVLLTDVSEDEARAAAENLLLAIRAAPAAFGGKPLRITASIGVTSFESDDSTASELFVNADLAMYAAKAEGRDRVVVYTPTQARMARSLARQPWSERIREALERDEFVLHMQPILDLHSGEISHGEFLLRMRDPHGKLIAPSAFLPTAERLGLIHAIDRWVVSHAIELIAEGGERALPVVGINLSADTVVGDPQMLGLIESEIRRTSVDPGRLIFEVTETAAIANMRDAASFARGLAGLGCGIALDDFGTGFASFYYLKHLPVDYVKLDGEFIQNLPRSEVDEHMVRAIVALSQSLGIKTVAESVNDEETIRLLRDHEVDYAQGFHVGRPEPLAAAG